MPLAQIFFPRRLSNVSSMPKTSVPSGTKASTSNSSRTRLTSLPDHAARLKTRWGIDRSAVRAPGPPLLGRRLRSSFPGLRKSARQEQLDMLEDAFREKWRKRCQHFGVGGAAN
jgi:hypothetical protein